MEPKLYAETVTQIVLPSRFICKSVLLSGFIFQQEDAPCPLSASAYMAKLAQHWTATNCSEFVGKDEWPSNLPLPDINTPDYLNTTTHFTPSREHWQAEVLQLTWYQQLQDSVNKDILSFTETLSLSVKTGVEHSNQLWDNLCKFLTCNERWFNLTLKITSDLSIFT